MPRKHSSKLLKLLEELTKDWADPKRYRDYYANELLSSLKNDSERGSIEERLLMAQIREVASLEEWEHLGELVADLDRFKAQPEDIIKDLFLKGQYKEARCLYENTMPDVFKRVRSQHLREFIKRFDRHIERGSEFTVRHDLDRLAGLLTEVEWRHFDKLYWDAEIKFALPWLESCLNTADYRAVEVWFSKLEKAFPQEKSNDLVAEVKTRRINWRYQETLENVRRFINYELARFNYDIADTAYRSSPEAFSREEYQQLVRGVKIKGGKLME